METCLIGSAAGGALTHCNTLTVYRRTHMASHKTHIVWVRKTYHVDRFISHTNVIDTAPRFYKGIPNGVFAVVKTWDTHGEEVILHFINFIKKEEVIHTQNLINCYKTEARLRARARG